MHSFETDIAIVGGGPVGAALACALARRNINSVRITLFQNTRSNPAQDKRVLALNYGSRLFLESLGVWSSLPAAAIRHVHVSQQHRLGRVIINHDSLGVPELGYVVPYAKLHDSLQRLLADCERAGKIQISRSPVITPRSQGSGTRIDLSDQASIQAELALITAGTQPDADIHRDYGQTAIIASVRPRFFQDGWAWERFTRQGPAALLPHPLYEKAYSLVWCLPPKLAEQMLQASPPHFEEALNERFSGRLGKFRLIDQPLSYPLHLRALRNPVKDGMLYMGNAAQTMHPVAGQGLNLGLRDAAVFADVLGRHGTPLNVPALLKDYLAQRQLDRRITRRLTDLMPRVFTTRIGALEHLLGLGLLGMSLNPSASRPLSRHLLHGFRN